MSKYFKILNSTTPTLPPISIEGKVIVLPSYPWSTDIKPVTEMSIEGILNYFRALGLQLEASVRPGQYISPKDKIEMTDTLLEAYNEYLDDRAKNYGGLN